MDLFEKNNGYFRSAIVFFCFICDFRVICLGDFLDDRQAQAATLDLFPIHAYKRSKTFCRSSTGTPGPVSSTVRSS